MPMRQGKCINFGLCPKADSREVIEVKEDDEFACPGPNCRKPLQPIKTPPPPPPKWRWILGGSLVVLASAGLVLFLVSRQNANPYDPGRSSRMQVIKPPPPELPPPPPHPSCAPDGDRNTSLSDLNLLQKSARALAAQAHFDDAFSEFGKLAEKSPGFPGVNLDISNSLLQLRRIEDAEKAISRQLALSECMSKLQPKELQLYCKVMGLHTSGSSCQERLQSIWQLAYFQSALIHFEQNQSQKAREDVLAGERLGPRKAPKYLKDRFDGSDHHLPRPQITSNFKDGDLKGGEGTDVNLGRPR
jgi:tetratricopeptide (TPR) repeat protein